MYVIYAIIIFFLLYLVIKAFSLLNKASDYSAKNSFRPDQSNQNQNQSYYDSNSKVERILIKGHKFSIAESAAIWDAIKKGNKVEALWLIRSAPGISLNDAKKFVESKEKLNRSIKNDSKKETINEPIRNPEKAKTIKLELSKSQYASILSALEADNKITGIKLIREFTGLELADSKSVIGMIVEKMQSVAITKELVDVILMHYSKVNKELKDLTDNKIKKKAFLNLNNAELNSIKEALASGNKIRAMQLLSEMTGLGWHEVNHELLALENKFLTEDNNKKELEKKIITVGNNQAHQPLTESKVTSDAVSNFQEMSELIIKALDSRNKIEAVKRLKDATGFSLKESLEFIEKMDGKINQAPVKEIALNIFAKLLATEISLGTKADVNRIKL